MSKRTFTDSQWLLICIEVMKAGSLNWLDFVGMCIDLGLDANAVAESYIHDDNDETDKPTFIQILANYIEQQIAEKETDKQ